MSKLSIFLITLFSIFLLSEASMIFEKVKMDKIRYDLFSAAASMAGYIFKDLQFNEIIYNYNDNLIKFYDQKKYEIYYNSYDTLDYRFPNETTTEVFQKSPENPYLVMKVSFSLGVVDTEKTTSGTFTLYSSVYRMKKIYDDFSKMYVPKTKFEFTYKDLKVDDLSAVLIDEEFLKMIIKFFCYEQELRMAQLYNEKSAVVYYNDKQIPKQEKLVNVYGSQNKIDFTINSMEQLISKDAKVIAQQRRSGAVNGKVEEDLDSEFDTKVESCLAISKKVFMNIIKDSMFDFTLTNENNINTDFMLNMNYLGLISKDLMRLYPQSKKFSIVNKMKGIQFDEDNKEYISADLTVESTVVDENNKEMFKFETVLFINWHTNYILEKFNLSISLFKAVKITSKTDGIRINNKMLFKKWIEGTYGRFLSGQNNQLFTESLDLKSDGIITYNAYVTTTKNWIIFKDNFEN